MLNPTMFKEMAFIGMLSPTGRCHVFDDAADGQVRGEGCGAVVLKPLEDIQKGNDNVRAILKGLAVAANGNQAANIAQPNRQAQEKLINAALMDAQVQPFEIDFLESACVGSLFGDQIEMRAVASVLGRGRDVSSPLVMNGVKANIGHLEAASGIAGLIKTALVLRFEQATPNAALRSLSSKIRAVTADVPLHFPRVLKKLICSPQKDEDKIFAGVSSYAATGTIAHAIVGQPPQELCPEYPRTSDVSETQEPLFTKRISFAWASPPHPLLQQKLDFGEKGIQYKAVFHDSLIELLEDYTVQGRSAFPASGFLEMALAAAMEQNTRRGVALRLEDMEVLLPLGLVSGEMIMYDIVTSGDAASGQFYSSESASLLCVINGIKNNSIGSTETQLESLDVLNKRCRMEVSGVRDRYAHLERCGYPGPQFQALERVWREESATEVVGEIFNPKPGHRFKVHPAVVDAGIQLCAFRLLGSNSSSAWQFTRVKTITFFPEETYHEDRALWVYSTCAKYASFVEQQDVELTYFNGKKQAFLHLDGCRCIPTAAWLNSSSPAVPFRMAFRRYGPPATKRPARLFVISDCSDPALMSEIKEIVAAIDLQAPFLEIMLLDRESTTDQMFFQISLFVDTMNFILGIEEAGLSTTTQLMQSWECSISPSRPHHSFSFRSSRSVELNTTACNGSAVEVAGTIRDVIHHYLEQDGSSEIQEIKVMPSVVDNLIIGAGVAGLVCARELLAAGHECLVLDRAQAVGGVWYSQANASSRVNSAGPAYQLIDRSPAHIYDTPTQMIMDDITHIAAAKLAGRIRLRVSVISVRPSENDQAHIISYQDHRTGHQATLTAKRVFACVNRRLGHLREISWPGESQFEGEICYGAGNAVSKLSFHERRVVIVGAGAFAIENARTALERGATKVTVLSRRRGTILPLAFDYLNYVRPFDRYFKHDRAGTLSVLTALADAYKQCKATEPECWSQGMLQPVGVGLGSSDIWLVAHYYGFLTTSLGEIGNVDAHGVVTSTGESIPCDIIIKCVGFHKNEAAREMLGADTVATNCVVRPNLVYLAEFTLDDGGVHELVTGSSYLDYFLLSVRLLLSQLERTGNISPEGRMVDICGVGRSLVINYMDEISQGNASETIRTHVSKLGLSRLCLLIVRLSLGHGAINDLSPSMRSGCLCP